MPFLDAWAYACPHVPQFQPARLRSLNEGNCLEDAPA